MAKPARVEGTVFDSVAMKPLVGATVQLAHPDDPSRTRALTADAAGRFRFDSVEAGAWIVGVWHPRLDSLGVTQFARRTSVHAGERRRITLAVPSARSLIASMCGRKIADDTLGVIFGSIRRASKSREPVPTGTMRMQWLEVELSGAGVRRELVGFDQATRTDGDYIACGVPMDARVQVQASAGSDSSGVLEVLTNGSGIMRLDVLVATPQRREVMQVAEFPDSTGRPVIDSTRAQYLTGGGVVTGALTRSETRGVEGGTARVPNALATLWGTGTDVRSDASGTFTLRSLPLGTHTTEIRAIGYEPVRTLVNVLPDEPAALEIDLSRVTALDTVRVRARFDARNRLFDEAGFLSRQRTGRGVYRTPDELAQINPLTIRELFLAAPFVQAQWSVGAGEQITMGFGPNRCTPGFWVDGREMDGEQFQFFVRAHDVLAVEVYPRLSVTPPQFMSPRNMQGAGCGAIVVWTGVRSPANPRNR